MSYHEYKMSQDIAAHDYPFYGLIMAAMRKADTQNTEKLRRAFPDVFNELAERYNSSGGKLKGEQ